MNAVILTFMMIFGHFGVGYPACQGFMSMRAENASIAMSEKSSECCHMHQCAIRCEWVRHEIFLPLLRDTHLTIARPLQAGLRVGSMPVEVPVFHPVSWRRPTPIPDGLGVDVFLLHGSFLI